MIGSYRMFIQDISHSDQTKSPTANEMVRRTTAYIDTANIWCYMKYKFISLIKKNIFRRPQSRPSGRRTGSRRPKAGYIKWGMGNE